MKTPNLVPLLFVVVAAIGATIFAYQGGDRPTTSTATAEPEGVSGDTPLAQAALQAVEAEKGEERLQPAGAASTLSAPAGAPTREVELEELLANQDATIATLQDLLFGARLDLVLCQGRGAGTFGEWLGSLVPEEMPDQETLREVADRLAPYEGLHLQAHEGLWLAERSRLNDWADFGEGTQDTILIRYLGPERVVREMSGAPLDELLASEPEAFDH